MEPGASFFRVLGLQAHMAMLGFLSGGWDLKHLWSKHSYSLCHFSIAHFFEGVHYPCILNETQQAWNEDFGLSSLVICCRRNEPGLIFFLNL